MATGAFALSLTLFHGLRIVRGQLSGWMDQGMGELMAGFGAQVLQLNSLRPTNDAFCAVLRTRLKANLPLMKSLKPFSRTFFSEWYLSPERELEVGMEKKQKEEVNVGELISFDDDKGKGRALEEELEWTTKMGTGAGYHGGLGQLFRYPGDARKYASECQRRRCCG